MAEGESKIDAATRAAIAWREAKKSERDRMTELDAAIMEASESGVSEMQIVSITGINRLTVRRALGKPRKAKPVDLPAE